MNTLKLKIQKPTNTNKLKTDDKKLCETANPSFLTFAPILPIMQSTRIVILRHVTEAGEFINPFKYAMTQESSKDI